MITGVMARSAREARRVAGASLAVPYWVVVVALLLNWINDLTGIL